MCSALEKHPRLGAHQFDDVSTNWKKRSGQKEAEYDIVLLDGSAGGTVEAARYYLHATCKSRVAQVVDGAKGDA